MYDKERPTSRNPRERETRRERGWMRDGEWLRQRDRELQEEKLTVGKRDLVRDKEREGTSRYARRPNSFSLTGYEHNHDAKCSYDSNISPRRRHDSETRENENAATTSSGSNKGKRYYQYVRSTISSANNFT